MIEVRNLVKRYGDHIAVDHISFTVEPGQIYGFLGPNGAGKSTTMNMMTGYLGITEGEIIVNGHNILEEPEEAKRSIGYLPEQPPLYADMTVVEYLRFAAELKKIPKAERRTQVGKVVELCHIESMQNRLIKNLSKGYKQRVGLAQAILGFPPVIILDEPTVGLDPKQIIEIRDLIRSLRGEHTVILSSHILAEVQEVCDRVLIINNGKLVAEGTPEGLEQQLQGNKLTLTVLGTDTAALTAVLNGVGGLTDIECGVNGSRGEITVTCGYPQGQDPRAQLSQACAAAGFPVLSMKAAEVSLEQIFLQVTAGSGDETVTDEGAVDPNYGLDDEPDEDNGVVEVEVDAGEDEVDMNAKEKSAMEKYDVLTNEDEIENEANTGVEQAAEDEAEKAANRGEELNK